jgi:hypothetical protein
VLLQELQDVKELLLMLLQLLVLLLLTQCQLPQAFAGMLWLLQKLQWL